MTSAERAPQLRLIVNPETGEVVEGQEEERDLALEELQKKYIGALGEIGKLKRELREFRVIEPEAQQIRDVLEYCNERCGRRFQIMPGGKRWEKVRARFRDRIDDREPWTTEELKLATDGALLDPWLNGTAHNSKGYLDPMTIYRDPEQVERLRDLALGLQGRTGYPLSDLLECAEDLGVVSWRHILTTCECGHKRVEHSRGDPDHGGRERCLMCGCEDFEEDVFARLEGRGG